MAGRIEYRQMGRGKASSLAEDEDIGDTGFEEEDEKDDHPSAEKR